MTKPEPKLMHMPEHIKQMIIDLTLDMNTKLALRMVSKEFHAHLEKSPTNYTEVSMKQCKRRCQCSDDVADWDYTKWQNTLDKQFPDFFLNDEEQTVNDTQQADYSGFGESAMLH